MLMRVSVVFLLVAFCNASNNACQSSQSVFIKTKDNGMLHYNKENTNVYEFEDIKNSCVLKRVPAGHLSLLNCNKVFIFLF